MFLSTKPTGCFICLSPYRHRNLHTERLRDKLVIISPFEMDILPILWRNVMFKNPSFCDHVCHSWLTRSLKMMTSQTNGFYQPDPPDYDLIHVEAIRLEELIETLIDGIKKKEQVLENATFVNVYTAKILGKKKKVTWRSSGQRKIVGTWFGLAESLIEQYCAHLEMDDVHEREMRIIVWKHFILALIQCLLNSFR